MKIKVLKTLAIISLTSCLTVSYSACAFSLFDTSSESNSSNVTTLNFEYLEELFTEYDIPYTVEENLSKGYHDIIFQDGISRWSDGNTYNIHYNPKLNQLYFEYKGLEGIYKINFYNSVTKWNGKINDYNGTKIADVIYMYDANADISISSKDITEDIKAGDYGNEVLQIIHILYGDSFEDDLAAAYKKLGIPDATESTGLFENSMDIGSFEEGELGAVNYTTILQLFEENGIDSDNFEFRCFTVIDKILYSDSEETIDVMSCIIDGESREPVEGAMVTWGNEDSSETITTDNSGCFSFTCTEGSYYLTIYKEGYSLISMGPFDLYYGTDDDWEFANGTLEIEAILFWKE